MTKDRAPADNPTSALFDLAEHMANNYHKILYIKYYAYIFIGITILLLVLLSFYLFTQGNFAFLVILIALVICGFMLLRLILFTKNFLDDFDTNFRAIKLVRDIDPLPSIPTGKTRVERLEKYLKTSDPAILLEIKDGLEFKRNFNIGNKFWSLVIFRKPKSFGSKGYLLLVSSFKGEPKLGDCISLEKELATVAKQLLMPDRVIILYHAPANYDGISDDLYAYLTEKNHYIYHGGKNKAFKLQLFVEHAGKYEIIPILP